MQSVSGNHLKTRASSTWNAVLDRAFIAQHIFHFVFLCLIERSFTKPTNTMNSFAILCFLSCIFGSLVASTPAKDAMDAEWNKLKSFLPMPLDPLKLNSVDQTWCTCGVFLTGQFKKGSSEPPKGYPALMHEQDMQYPCTPIGTKQCSNKCLETVSLIRKSIFCKDETLFFSIFTPTMSVFFLIEIYNLISDCQTFAKLTNHSLWKYRPWCVQGTRLLVHPKLQRYMDQHQLIRRTRILLQRRFSIQMSKQFNLSIFNFQFEIVTLKTNQRKQIKTQLYFLVQHPIIVFLFLC